MYIYITYSVFIYCACIYIICMSILYINICVLYICIIIPSLDSHSLTCISQVNADGSKNWRNWQLGAEGLSREENVWINHNGIFAVWVCMYQPVSASSLYDVHRVSAQRSFTYDQGPFLGANQSLRKTIIYPFCNYLSLTLQKLSVILIHPPLGHFCRFPPSGLHIWFIVKEHFCYLLNS